MVRSRRARAHGGVLMVSVGIVTPAAMSKKVKLPLIKQVSTPFISFP